MNKISWIIVLATALSLSVLGGCKSSQTQEEGASTEQQPMPEAAPETTQSTASDDNVMGDSDSGKASGMQTVSFPYDSFAIDAEAKTVLSSNHQILQSRPTLKIQIEGHCDQRGGIQYNLALGEKRVAAVKKYLEGLGVTSDRITTISYGKEKLMDSESSEAAHAKNRRANFVVTSK